MIPFLLSRSDKFIKAQAFLLAIIFLCSVSCSGALRQTELQNELYYEAMIISADMDRIPELKDKRAGRAGYYYILDRDGRVAYHPRTMLVGTDMSSYSFVQRILESDRGCISFVAEGNVTVIFFKRINQLYTLCLSVPGDAVTGGCDCQLMNVSD